MPAATFTPGRIVFLCLSGLATLWLLGFFQAGTMDSIPSTFTIEIDGKPIAKVDGGAEDHTEAKLGEEPAIFSLKDSRLQCSDHIMGRNLAENRSFGPKPVSWYKVNGENVKRVQAVTAKKEGDAYQLLFANAPLMVTDEGTVMADLMARSKSEVKVILLEN